MRQPHLFAVALILALAGLSVAVDQRAREQHVLTGTVREWNAGESITIASEHRLRGLHAPLARYSVRGAHGPGSPQGPASQSGTAWSASHVPWPTKCASTSRRCACRPARVLLGIFLWVPLCVVFVKASEVVPRRDSGGPTSPSRPLGWGCVLESSVLRVRRPSHRSPPGRRSSVGRAADS